MAQKNVLNFKMSSLLYWYVFLLRIVRECTWCVAGKHLKLGLVKEETPIKTAVVRLVHREICSSKPNEDGEGTKIDSAAINAHLSSFHHCEFRAISIPLKNVCMHRLFYFLRALLGGLLA